MCDKWGLTVRGICEYEGKILLLKVHSESRHDAGKWEIPGGKVKRNEFFDDALKREYLEETALEINIESLFNVVENTYIACKSNEKINSVQLIMKVSASSGEVQISPEHDEYKWFTRAEIKELILNNLLTPPAIDSFKKTIFECEL